MTVASENQKVSGLYQRALEYLKSQRHLRLVRPDDVEEFSGTPEERAHIEDEIRRAVEENRIVVGPETFRLVPQRRGSGLPILVNLAALILIVGGVYLLLQLFDTREQELSSGPAAIISAEGRLLAALRTESAAQLQEKQTEIAEIERRLQRVQSEREQIRAEAVTRLSQREAELRVEFGAALEAERLRLAAQELSAEEQTARLAGFRETREAQLQSDIATARAEEEVDLRRQEAAIAAVVSEYQQTLDAAQVEREALQEQLNERESELRAGFVQREAAIASERTAALELLEELRSQQEQERLILDQTLSFYAQIREQIAAGRLDQAGESLASLRGYLEDGAMATIPELQRRRQVELFLVGTLEDRVEQTRRSNSADTRSLAESAGLIAEVSELAARGEADSASGNLEQARELYLAALARIPAVRIGYSRLQEIESQLGREESQRVAALIADGNALYRAGDYQAAADQYGEVIATLPSADDDLLARILDAGYQMRSTDSLAALEQLRDELAARAQEIDAQAAAIRTSEAMIAARDTEIEDLRSRIRSVDQLAAADDATVAGLEAELGRSREELTTAQAAMRTTSELIDRLRSDLSARDAALAAATDRLAATESELAAATDRLAATESELAQLRARRSEKLAIVEQIGAYRQTFERATVDRTTATVSSLELLETKLLILRIVGSDAVRADHPDLNDRLNAYLDALVAEQRVDAVTATLNELDSLLVEVERRSRSGAASIEALALDYPILASPAAARPAGSLLRRLQRLVAPDEP